MRSHLRRSFVGVDLGTSGCRAVAIDAAGREIARAAVAVPTPSRQAPGSSAQDPELWWDAVSGVLGQLADDLTECPPASVCIDATSSTLLLARENGSPATAALMYNDQSSTEAASLIARVAPSDSPARGPTSSLAKLLALRACLGSVSGRLLALHQADWIAGRLLGRYGTTDWNNALKLGFDLERLEWPAWVKALIPSDVSLPRVVRSGEVIGATTPEIADAFGFPLDTVVTAGTTDSTAAVVAAGAARPGDAVTSLGSTLVLKIVSEKPILASDYGVYSHRLGDHWLAGGASNSGGSVLRQFFAPAEIEALSLRIDPNTDTGLGYYPLPSVGERFPRAAPAMRPALHPRPEDPCRFLQGLLEGIAAIEAEGYRRLVELGAPAPRQIRTLGGGAANEAWRRIRSRYLGTDVETCETSEAAYGAAILARAGVRHRNAASAGTST